jgi:hypothetical protein
MVCHTTFICALVVRLLVRKIRHRLYDRCHRP